MANWKIKQEVLPEEVKAVGGYKIYILNHVKEGECKYNIVSTKGKVWNYTSKEMFMDKLKELLIAT